MLFALFYIVTISILVLHFTGFLARHNLEWLVLVLVHDDAGVDIENLRIVRTDFFDHLAIARAARIYGANAVVRAMLPPHLLHANPNCHESSPLKLTN